MKPARIIANLVGMMLFVQVILGGGSVVLGWDVTYHIYWGAITFVVLIVASVMAFRDYGARSNIFRVGIAAIADFVVQIILGFISLNDPRLPVVVHLTNAFVLGVFTTYLISFADSAEKTGAIRSGIVKPLGT